MTFDVEVVVREQSEATAERLFHAGHNPPDWTEADVRGVLEAILLAVNRAKHPGQPEPVVALRGFSWIVEPMEGGVVIAIEIPTGAAVAGPFDIAQDRLDALIRRVVQADAPTSPVVH